MSEAHTDEASCREGGRHVWRSSVASPSGMTAGLLANSEDWPKGAAGEGVGGGGSQADGTNLCLLLIGVQLVVFVAVETLCERQAIGNPGYQCQLYHRPRKDRCDGLSVSLTALL